MTALAQPATLDEFLGRPAARPSAAPAAQPITAPMSAVEFMGAAPAAAPAPATELEGIGGLRAAMQAHSRFIVSPTPEQSAASAKRFEQLDRAQGREIGDPVKAAAGFGISPDLARHPVIANYLTSATDEDLSSATDFGPPSQQASEVLKRIAPEIERRQADRAAQQASEAGKGFWSKAGDVASTVGRLAKNAVTGNPQGTFAMADEIKAGHELLKEIEPLSRSKNLSDRAIAKLVFDHVRGKALGSVTPEIAAGLAGFNTATLGTAGVAFRGATGQEMVPTETPEQRTAGEVGGFVGMFQPGAPVSAIFGRTAGLVNAAERAIGRQVPRLAAAFESVAARPVMGRLLVNIPNEALRIKAGSLAVELANAENIVAVANGANAADVLAAHFERLPEMDPMTAIFAVGFGALKGRTPEMLAVRKVQRAFPKMSYADAKALLSDVRQLQTVAVDTLRGAAQEAKAAPVEQEAPKLPTSTVEPIRPAQGKEPLLAEPAKKAEAAPVTEPRQLRASTEELEQAAPQQGKQPWAFRSAVPENLPGLSPVTEAGRANLEKKRQPDGSVILYHGTSDPIADAAQATGITGDAKHGAGLTTSVTNAGVFAGHRAGPHGKTAILIVRVPPEEVPNLLANKSDVSFGHAGGRIPPEWIIGRTEYASDAALAKMGAEPEPTSKQSLQVAPEPQQGKQPWDTPGNPFAAKAKGARAKYESLVQPTAREREMESAFPLGAGYGRPGAERRADASISRAKEAQKALRDAEWFEARAKAYAAGEINAQGRRPAADADAQARRREDLKARSIEASARVEGQEIWQTRGSDRADAAKQFGGNGRKLILGEHQDAIEQAVSEGKPVPREVLEDYRGTAWADAALAKLSAPAAEAQPQPPASPAGEKPKPFQARRDLIARARAAGVTTAAGKPLAKAKNAEIEAELTKPTEAPAAPTEPKKAASPRALEKINRERKAKEKAVQAEPVSPAPDRLDIAAAAAKERLKALLNPATAHDITDIIASTPAVLRDLSIIGAKALRDLTRAGLAATKSAWRKKMLEEHGIGLEPALDRIWGEIPKSPEGKAVLEGEVRATAIKNEVGDLERAELDLPLSEKGDTLTEQAVVEHANRAFEADPLVGVKLVKELSAKNRPMDGYEVGILLHEKVRLTNERTDAQERFNEARRKGDDDAAQSAQIEIDTLANDFALLTEVAKKSGTPGAQGLRMRQMLQAQDYSLAAVEQTLVAANDGQATPEVRQHAKELSEKLIAAEKRAADAEAAAERYKAEAAFAKAHQEMTTPKPARLGGGRIKFSEPERVKLEAAFARIKSKLSPTRPGIGADITVVKDLAEVAALYIKAGTRQFARWAGEMTANFGKEVEPHLKAAWRTASKENAAEIRSGLLDDFTKRADAAEAAGKEPPSAGSLAKDIARTFIDEGITEQQPLLKAVRGELETVFPGITEVDTMKAISGYGKYRRLDQDPVEVVLRQRSTEYLELSKLAALGKGEPLLKTGMEREPMTDEARRLVAEVNEAKKRSGYKADDPDTQLKGANDAIQTRLKNQIADLEEQIRTRTKFTTEKRTIEYDAETKQLQAKRDALKQDFYEIFGRPSRKMTDAQRNEAARKRFIRRAQELRDRMASQDFGPRPERVPLKLSMEALQAQKALEETQREYGRAEFEYKMANRTRLQKIADAVYEVASLPRSLKASYDESALGRQGWFFAAGHPLKTIRSGLGRMLRATFSDERAFENRRMIETDPLYSESIRAGAEFTDMSRPGTRFSEEEFRGRLPEKIAGTTSKKLWLPRQLARGIIGSGRGYSTFLNWQRLDMYRALRRSMVRDGTPTLQQSKDLWRLINSATGRPNLGKFAAESKLLSAAFWAPRFVASRFQLLLGIPLWRAHSWGARRVVAQEYARFLGGVGTILTLAGWAGADIEIDPRSTDFLQIKIGNTRIDVTAGLSKATTFLVRMLWGETKNTKGEIVPLRGNKVPFGKDTIGDVFIRFGRTKLSPVPGTIADIMAGQNVVGEPTTPVSVAAGLTVPLSFKDIYEAMKEQGVPAGAAMGLISLFGFSMNTYSRRKKSS